MDDNKHKIYYTKEGWLCERYPYDLPIENESFYIEVDEATYYKTLGCDKHFSWRVKDGQLTHERYEETPEAETLQELLDKRAEICFPIINRGQPWHERLTPGQKEELAKWYADWLDITKTKIEPTAPSWLFKCEKGETNNVTN